MSTIEDLSRLRSGSAERYCAFGLWLFVFLIYFSLARQWITSHSYDERFTEYSQHVSELAATQHRPAEDVRLLLLVKAEELSIPLHYDGINISGEGDAFRTVIHYDTELKIPVLNRVGYRVEFKHDLTHKAW